MISRSTDIRSALRSRQRGFLLNPYRFAPGVSTAPIWDAATVSSPLVLSNADRRLTLPVGNSAIAKSVKALTALSGKIYWEVLVVSCIGGATTTTGMGIAESTFDFAGSNLAGSSTTDSGAIWLSGAVYFGGSSITTMVFGYSAGDRALFAYDTATGKFWVGAYGPGFSGNPAAGTGEVRVLNTGKTYFPAATPWSSDGSNAVILDICGSGNIVGTPPAGFTTYAL